MRDSLKGYSHGRREGRPSRNKIVFICKLLLAQHLLLNAVNSFTQLVMAEGVQFNFGIRRPKRLSTLTARARNSRVEMQARYNKVVIHCSVLLSVKKSLPFCQGTFPFSLVVSRNIFFFKGNGCHGLSWQFEQLSKISAIRNA